MSDERARELERRWRESGLVEDRAAWLRERMRSGELPPEKLQLAAALGDAAACTVLGWPERVDPFRLARILEPLGLARCISIAGAASDLVIDRCEVLRNPRHRTQNLVHHDQECPQGRACLASRPFREMAQAALAATPLRAAEATVDAIRAVQWALKDEPEGVARLIAATLAQAPPG